MIKEKSTFKEEQRENVDEILSFKEATEFLKSSRSFLYKMTSQKLITHYVPGGKRIYFKKSDLENWLLKNRIPPTSELEVNVENYMLNSLKTNKND
jgi:excisionase family DNA binding protein